MLLSFVLVLGAFAILHWHCVCHKGVASQKVSA